MSPSVDIDPTLAQVRARTRVGASLCLARQHLRERRSPRKIRQKPGL
jgi:hypothetical protein